MPSWSMKGLWPRQAEATAEIGGTSSLPAELPIPPFEMRQLVGPTDPEMFDNPRGEPVFADVPEGAYDNVFDFGSGCGRLARQMMQQSPVPARYRGIDLHEGMVRWCHENLTPANPGFSFAHHNVFNPGFNPDPSLPRFAPFPIEDGAVTLMIAWSVFTHTTQRQTEHYIKETARVLHDRGILVSTWFLFEKKNFPMMQDFQNALYINEFDPTNATIFDRTWLVDLLASAGLQVTLAKPPGIRGFQWVLHISKKGQGAPVELGEDVAPYGRKPPPVVTRDPSRIGRP